MRHIKIIGKINSYIYVSLLLIFGRNQILLTELNIFFKKYFTKLHKYCYNHLHNYFIFIMTPEAERFNGWAAMLGFVAAVGAYVTTGQIIPGWF